MKKFYWNKKRNKYEEKNLSSNRIALYNVRRHFGNKKFNLTDFISATGFDRVRSYNMLYSLRNSGFLKSKANKPNGILDNRVYFISAKGRNKLPRKKIPSELKKRDVEIVEKIIERPVEVEKRYDRRIIPREEI